MKKRQSRETEDYRKVLRTEDPELVALICVDLRFFFSITQKPTWRCTKDGQID
jgi:hypothetical protein